MTKKNNTKETNSSKNHVEIWKELKEKFSDLPPQIYSTGGSFSVNTTIDHPHFGFGIVTSSFSNKIEVCFKEGIKALIHRKE